MKLPTQQDAERILERIQPKVDEAIDKLTKTERLVLRVSAEDKEIFEKAATAEFLDFSAWVRRALHKQAIAEAKLRE